MAYVGVETIAGGRLLIRCCWLRAIILFSLFHPLLQQIRYLLLPFTMTASSNNSSSRRGGSNVADGSDAPVPSEISTIALTILGTFVAGRCLAVVSRLATVLAAPVAGFYLMTTCPTNESFDAKKELKRVLRG